MVNIIQFSGHTVSEFRIPGNLLRRPKLLNDVKNIEKGKSYARRSFYGYVLHSVVLECKG